MRFADTVSNPMLSGALNLMMSNPDVEYKKMFIQEVMRSEFLMPVRVMGETQTNENGEVIVPEDTQVNFPLLANKAGVKFYMAFTSRKEFEKWPPHDNFKTMAFTYQDYFDIIMSKDEEGNYNPGFGFVIDPFSYKIVFDRNKMINLYIRSSDMEAEEANTQTVELKEEEEEKEEN